MKKNRMALTIFIFVFFVWMAYAQTVYLKNLLGRLLLIFEPFMVMDRYPEDKQQCFVVFSAAGFPEVEHNFDGLIAMFRCFHSHFEKSFLMGEFYMPGAEMISQPVYADRSKRIEQACFDAGKQAVKEEKLL